ncbi:MAG TPA: lysophospholipid acyltransferase family protein [Pyrinomonadaceae bacterium]|nr:lysophospholipid acyltransferase family protein [Pyrinomonadaceae bacterium]
MSETATNIARKHRRDVSQNGPVVLPQWALGIIRTTCHRLSHLLWPINYQGVEHIPPSGGLIIAANHQTYIDPFWISFPVKRPTRYLAWNEAFHWPVVGKFIGLLGAWPLQLEKSDPTPIRRSLQWLRGGGVVVIFPEGERGLPDGSMSKFKNGAVRMALEANVPILPVTIRGAHRVWPRAYRFPRFTNIEIIYHPIFRVAQRQGEDARVCARRESERLADIIRSSL